MGAPTLDAVALCEAMVKRARERKMFKAVEPPAIVEEQKQLSVPLQSVPFQWGEGVRGTPNILIRGALFGVVKSGERRLLQQEEIFCAGGYSIFFTGEQLDQGDLDIWQLAAHLCQGHLGEFVLTSRKKMLRALGRSGGRGNKLWLMRGLDRMVSGSAKLIEMRAGIKNEPRQFNDNLLGYAVDGDHLSLRVSREWATFFLSDAFTLIDWERRLSLPARAQLARWLHDFYSSHETPFPYKVQTLRQMCGSRTSDLHRFREGLKEALGLVKEVGLLSDWAIDHRDLVKVEKNNSVSQNRSRLRKIVGGRAGRLGGRAGGKKG